MSFQYRLHELMYEKGQSEGRAIQLKEVVEATDISRNTLHKIYHNRPADYPTNAKVIARLCWYFQCTPNDLLVITWDEDAA